MIPLSLRPMPLQRTNRPIIAPGVVPVAKEQAKSRAAMPRLDFGEVGFEEVPLVPPMRVKARIWADVFPADHAAVKRKAALLFRQGVDPDEAVALANRQVAHEAALAGPHGEAVQALASLFPNHGLDGNGCLTAPVHRALEAAYEASKLHWVAISRGEQDEWIIGLGLWTPVAVDHCILTGYPTAAKSPRWQNQRVQEEHFSRMPEIAAAWCRLVRSMAGAESLKAETAPRQQVSAWEDFEDGRSDYDDAGFEAQLIAA